MFSFFKSKKVNINSIHLPDFDYQITLSSSSIIQWSDAEDSIHISKNFFNIPPNIPNTNDITQLRSFYRNSINQVNGGIIEVETFRLQNFDAVRTIFKIPQQPSGMVYLASLTIPFQTCSFVIKAQCNEVDISGIRDTIIAEKLLNEKKIQLDDNGHKGWFIDPYDSALSTGTLMNKSELSEYDSYFPEHPLTLARNIIKAIEENIVFEEEVYKLKSFFNK
ncbi:hypothetical protein [Hymenobacter rigui]|uniref:Uncharacterized protein n=1 Tax=Hymenobacter rigui TaxID=334424 RepID=A0A3R9N3D3_9BACT|nr:hypothetical protein [Hymenobacter rigui]RSK47217.1 hypothetical protein EI291_16635 [Hymenobacter rigui]